MAINLGNYFNTPIIYICNTGYIDNPQCTLYVLRISVRMQLNLFTVLQWLANHNQWRSGCLSCSKTVIHLNHTNCYNP